MPAIRAPRRWQLALGTLLLLALVFGLLSLTRAAIQADLITPPAWLPVTVLSFAVPLALVVTFVAWSNLTKGLVEGYGGMVAVVRNWAMTCGWLILFLSYLLPMKTPTAFHLARAAAAILIVIGLLISRNKLERWLAEPAAPAGTEPGAIHPPPSLDDPQQRGSGTPIARPAPVVEAQPQDWDASLWDPEIQADIERRRRSSGPLA